MEEKIFAKGYCFAKVFIFFVIGCLIGTYYEEILWFPSLPPKNQYNIFITSQKPLYCDVFSLFFLFFFYIYVILYVGI